MSTTKLNMSTCMLFMVCIIAQSVDTNVCSIRVIHVGFLQGQGSGDLMYLATPSEAQKAGDLNIGQGDSDDSTYNAYVPNDSSFTQRKYEVLQKIVGYYDRIGQRREDVMQRIYLMMCMAMIVRIPLPLPQHLVHHP